MLKTARFWNGPKAQTSQGGVKFPTGGKWSDPSARERLLVLLKGSSRFGANPKPTVIVRMEEKKSNRKNVTPIWRAYTTFLFGSPLSRPDSYRFGKELDT